MSIRPIETRYNGYRFRSRTEARWAVFFDAIYMRYHYEVSGYDLGGIAYLPDFRLKGEGTFPHAEYVEVKPGTPTRYEWNKAVLLCYGLESAVHIFAGEPGLNTRVWTLEFADSYLPEFLVGSRQADTTHAMPPYACCYSLWAQCKVCTRIDLARRWHNQNRPPENYCNFCYAEGDGVLDMESPALLAAFTSARSARFEHGETPEGTNN